MASVAPELERVPDCRTRGCVAAPGRPGGTAHSLSPPCRHGTALPADLLDGRRAAAKGFMPEDEGLFLHERAVEAGGRTVRCSRWAPTAASPRSTSAPPPGPPGRRVFTVDHHRGSEENQAGWEHHDATLVDPRTGRMDTLPGLPPHHRGRRARGRGRRRRRRAPPPSARHWRTPLALLFIDGGHGEEPAHTDYEGWAPWVRAGRAAAHPRRVPRPAPTAADRRTRSTCGRSRTASRRSASCGSMRALRRTPVSRRPGQRR